MLVRTWNLFHGNTLPPERRAHLREMIELAAADRPEVLLLQEIPAWALPRLGGWAGMRAAAIDVAARPPLGAWLGLWITRVNNGLIRSAFAGQGNAILVAPHLEPFEEQQRTVLNPFGFRRQVAKRLRLTRRDRRRWAGERRICQVVRVRLSAGGTLLVANLHASNHPDVRVRDAELERAFDVVGAGAEPTVFGGDFNRSPLTSESLRSLMERNGFSGGGEGIDQILVRGVVAAPPERWPEDRRRSNGRLLSDHAPVEVRLDVR